MFKEWNHNFEVADVYQDIILLLVVSNGINNKVQAHPDGASDAFEIET
jgi:hypothetical protein